MHAPWHIRASPSLPSTYGRIAEALAVLEASDLELASWCLFDLAARKTHPCFRGSCSTRSETLPNKHNPRGPLRDSLLLLPTCRTLRDCVWRREIPEHLARCGSPCLVPHAVWSLRIEADTLWVSYLVVLADTCMLAARIVHGPQQDRHLAILLSAEDASSCPGPLQPSRRRRQHATTSSARTRIARSPQSPSFRTS